MRIFVLISGLICLAVSVLCVVLQIERDGIMPFPWIPAFLGLCICYGYVLCQI